jgi:DNA-binding CsgD family transcriptional regulator
MNTVSAASGFGVVRVTSTRRRARDDIVRLTKRTVGLTDYFRRATAAVRRAVPADGFCLLTLDPATLLPTVELTEDCLPAEARPRMGEIEQREPDFNKFVTLARRRLPAASLSEATDGELHRSLRQREILAPSGFGDELRVTLGDGSRTWAALTLLRRDGRPAFTPGDVSFMGSLSGVLADGVRRSLLANPAVDESHSEPGFVVLAPDGTVEMSNRDADHWLAVLGRDGASALPTAVLAVAARARAGNGQPATARVPSAHGHWVVVRGSLLGHGPDACVGIHLDGARARDVAPLIVATYGLTEREQTITELVARGRTTNEIAAELHVSAYTVQDHLKAIFQKSGTTSRGELVARLFVDRHRATRSD